MKLKWTDINDIAIELVENHPDVVPETIRFTDLMHWVTSLADFDDQESRCNEKILEAIQQAWIEEKNE